MFPARRRSPLTAARQALEDAKLNPETLTLEERRRIGSRSRQRWRRAGVYRAAICALVQRRAEESQCLYHSHFDHRNAEQRNLHGISFSRRQSYRLDRVHQFH